jgi:hypothetical protein
VLILFSANLGAASVGVHRGRILMAILEETIKRDGLYSHHQI